MDSGRNDERERRPPDGPRSVWDIPAEWVRAWLTIFTILSGLGFVVVILDEIYGWPITGSIIDVIIVMAVVFAVSAASAFLMLRGVKIIIMLAHWLEQRTEKLRARQRAEGHAEGLEEGRAEGLEEGRAERDSEWLEWLERSRQAAANGQPFDEPPPSLNGDQSTQE